MQFTESPEQSELRSSVRRFLAEKSPSTAVREQMETVAGYDDAVWKQLSVQLGLPSLAIPEEYGGAGFSFVEQCIVLEEMGRTLYCGPFFASAVLAATVLLKSGDEQAKSRYLPGIASGETIATLAFTDDSGGWSGNGSGLSAADGKLTGHRNFVLDGHNAALVLATARTPEGLFLYAVDAHAAGLTATALPTLDQTRRLARLEFDGVEAELIGPAEAALAATLDVAALALAAEQLGGAQAALDMAVAYGKIREQFGKPIGSFQALKHRCADLLLEVESTRSAVIYGSWAVAEDADEVPVVASLAKAYASETFFHAAAENIQLHGGIGFTWEHDAHLYFKRAKASELLFGDPAYHRERLAGRIGI
ncbi:alkylation response protein AidB-like acyl-CoA dehydrogenase [Amycolatopsis bartoniae]|uniref:Acyl-CoA dehydrogenase n=1 Tax=Amycolatopsis bartoniae TaxID=941986 RepID=A0A8H9IWW9_9PSEU|nr:acyl-CoA dehydrogenase family protein [Amycolatopsis bartoniae]MBB2936857.1 alkylation response protein AidB-like acyl-CoA dehydrogenase [Amycolatopsis bartoniae]TVT07238.1 acyl-CoA dehydrogenase [Amycolatopsis bartoniae]GHF50677.1 acyl-CoA dehydrogenase [Amycolatopsis bartoniae]